MFIRWQKRNLASRHWYRDDSSISWRAVLVESERVDGKPVPRHIGYVSSIGDAEIADPEKRQRFWDDTLANIDKLIPPRKWGPDGLRERLIATLAKKVPRDAG
jgi:hypothetical protein